MMNACHLQFLILELYRRQSYCGGCWKRYALQCLFHHPPSVGRSIQGLKYRITDLDRMLSIDDSEKLTIPLAIYVSKDEPLNEVRWLLSQYCMFALFAYGLDLQYNKILSVLSKKLFSHKNDYKNYSNMLVLLHESPCFD